MSSSAQQLVSEIMGDLGFSRWGMAPLGGSISLSFYREWVNENMHGSMDYLVRHLPIKENPDNLLPRAQSAIVIAVSYKPHPHPDLKNVKHLKVAAYARGEDYHHWLQRKLEVLVERLKERFPGHDFLAATDSQPVLERDLAYRAGLGWFGKNTCLIDQKSGSYFLIGEVLTTLNFSTVQNLHPDRCGTCTRCIEACPTEAIVAPRKLDARKCISYLTIESKSVPPVELRGKIGDHFFGCDICQAVCPWNEKIFGTQEQFNALEDDENSVLIEELRTILTSSNNELEKRFRSTPLSRARGFGLKRNALVVIGNTKLAALRTEVSLFVSDPRLGELAEWVLSRLA